MESFETFVCFFDLLLLLWSFWMCCDLGLCFLFGVIALKVMTNWLVMMCFRYKNYHIKNDYNHYGQNNIGRLNYVQGCKVPLKFGCMCDLFWLRKFCLTDNYWLMDVSARFGGNTGHWNRFRVIFVTVMIWFDDIWMVFDFLIPVGL